MQISPTAFALSAWKRPASRGLGRGHKARETGLLMTKGFDGVELRRCFRRVQAENHPDGA
jgi:hypothetical protein